MYTVAVHDSFHLFTNRAKERNISVDLVTINYIFLSLTD